MCDAQISLYKHGSLESYTTGAAASSAQAAVQREHALHCVEVLDKLTGGTNSHHAAQVSTLQAHYGVASQQSDSQ